MVFRGRLNVHSCQKSVSSNSLPFRDSYLNLRNRDSPKLKIEEDKFLVLESGLSPRNWEDQGYGTKTVRDQEVNFKERSLSKI